jgi:hypothetical protein
MTGPIITLLRTRRGLWLNGTFALRVTRVVREVRSTGAMHRAMPAQLFPSASQTTLGSPAMSVTDILGTSLAMRITNI